MGVEYEKYKEFVGKVGVPDMMYCGVQKKQTQHIYIQDKVVADMFTSTIYHFDLKCKECGNTTRVFSY